jgi:hypothetical protein
MKKYHEKIIAELCLTLNNCGDCVTCLKNYTSTCDCDINTQLAHNSLEVFKVTEKSFRIDGNYNNILTRKLLEVARKLLYNFEIVKCDNGDEFIQFSKQ